MVKKLSFLSTILLFVLIPNLQVKAIQVGSLNGLNITQNENGTNVQYSLINDYFSYTQGTTRYVFSNNQNFMWKGINVYSADEHVYTTNLNYYFTNPCSSNDNVSYNQRIAFFFINTDEYPLNTLNVVNNINGCSGYWTKEDSTYYYNQSCSLSAGSSILGSLYFSEPSLSSWQVSNYRIGIQDDFDVKCEVNTNALIDNNNANTQNIINNNTNNTNQIIQNNEQNTQDIIDNQNSNTDKEIASQQVCFGPKFVTTLSNKYLYRSGDKMAIAESNNTSVYVYDVSELSTVTFKFLNYNRLRIGTSNNLYTSSGSLISFVTSTDNPTIGNSYNFSTNGEKYMYFFLSNSSSIAGEIEFDQLCKNGNQALNDSVNGLNDTLSSEDTPNTSQDIQDMDDMVASDTPISDLITMPLTLINAYIGGINSTCSPVNLGNLYGTDLILPCINLEQRLGSNLWSMIDIFFCIFMCYNIGMLFVSAFDGITSLRDDFEGLYQPRHADNGYQPRHGGGN